MRFAIGVKEAHTRVFDGCFAIMKRDLRFNVCELEDSFRLNKDVLDLNARISKHISEALQYGCLWWLSHLEESDIHAKKVEEVLAFLTSVKGFYWIEAISLMDVVDRGIVILQDCASFYIVRLFTRNSVQYVITKSRLNRVSWK